MAASVLFDQPGPATLRRHRLYTVVTVALVLVVGAWVVWKLNDAGQFESRIWNKLLAANVWREIRQGLTATLIAAAVAIVTAIITGLLLAVGRLSDHRWVSRPCLVFIEFFRAVPLLLLMLFLFSFIGAQFPELERNARAFLAVVVGLTLYNGSVLAEVFRAGIQAVPRGQSEAAYAIGLRKTQVMTMILLPQAVRFMLPAIISQCVVVLKDTSLGFIVTYDELLRSAKTIATYVGSSLMTYVVIAAIYIVLNSLLSALATVVEGSLGRRGKATAAAVEQVEEAAGLQ
ncbi:MAG: amino acid ABC transporter permease [Nocardioides sp.]